LRRDKGEGGWGSTQEKGWKKTEGRKGKIKEEDEEEACACMNIQVRRDRWLHFIFIIKSI
jgi:hypothetical protein